MATNAASAPTASVGDYVGWLARRWWLVAIAVVVGGVGGLGVAATQPKVYVSETKVLVMQVGQDTTAKVNLDTESQVVRSTTVGGAAKNLINTDTSVEELVSRVTVTVPANTSVLSITFDAPTVAEAQRGSQAFAQAYLDQRAAEAQKNVDVQGAAMRDEIAGLTKQLDEVAAQLVGLAANSADRQKAVQKQQILTSQINTLNARLIPLLATTVKPGNILSAATKPTSPAKPDLMLYLVSGVAIGLLLGLAGALVLDRMDSRIYHSRQIPYRNDVPVLMEVQRGRDKAVADAASALGREFSLLRNVLRVAAGAARGGRPSATDALLICGAAPGPAVEFVVANLAAAFARSGERVVIVCTDSTSHLPGMLGVSPARGLGDVIAGDVTLDSALYAVPAIRGVSLLGAGRLDPRVELPVATVSDLLAQLQQQADRVLLATAPPSRAVDAQALSEIAASVLLVVETRVARAEDVEESVEQVARVQGPLAGLLVVRSPRVARKLKKAKAVPGAAVIDQPVVPAPADLPRAGRDFDQTMVIPRVGEDGDRIEFWAPGDSAEKKVNSKRSSSSDQTTSADLR